MTAAVTLPALLRRNAERFAGRVAVREKRHGVWQELTWADYAARVERLTLGLRDLGLGESEPIAILTDNRPEWLYAELAAQVLRAVPLSLYADMEDLEGLRYLLDFSEAVAVLAENQEQADKVLALRDRLPRLRWLIVDDFHELRGYADPILVALGDVMDRGARAAAEQPGLWGELVDKVGEDDVALLSTTSGTTARPKIAMLSHRSLLAPARALREVDRADGTDEYVSFLPPAWIGERMTALAWALTEGFTVNFPEKPETVRRDLREIGPTIMFAPPRIWEKMLADLQVRVEDSTWLKRQVYRALLPAGGRMADARLSGKPVPFHVRAGYAVAYALLFRKIKDHLGLSRLRYVYTGGAALGPEAFRFFQALGVNIKQVYGQTETSGIVVMHRTGAIRLETVGRPLPGVEVKVADNGEILVRGDAVFTGYYRRPEATAAAMKDGWLCTGDQGFLDESGELVMVDRLGDVMELTGGSRFAPQYLETKLRFSPYVREAVVVGHRRPCVAALVQIDMDTVGKWAEGRRLPFTTFTELSQKPEVSALVRAEIARANRGLPEATRVRRFALLAKELDAEQGELTQTQKVRRGAIAERYAALIETLYADPAPEGTEV
ncbi:MAG: AMP-binding protein [Candidatus Rokubacteria bacterium]|nr:AMP-binding protein [Candidatus Rokubacteria bacterium]